MSTRLLSFLNISIYKLSSPNYSDVRARRWPLRIKTTFTFNRSDKDPSQRNNMITGIPVEKALGDKYTIDEEYIPEGGKVVGVSEIRISETGAAATVTD